MPNNHKMSNRYYSHHHTQSHAPIPSNPAVQNSATFSHAQHEENAHLQHSFHAFQVPTQLTSDEARHHDAPPPDSQHQQYAQQTEYANHQAIHQAEHAVNDSGLSLEALAAAADSAHFVNAKQFHRILVRRAARARIAEILAGKKERDGYLYESRHLHAVKRKRGPKGRFLTKEEQDAQNQKRKTEKLDD